jgi:Ran GTPase-activating protein (RanGAP) involved in mRNA processing and transport
VIACLIGVNGALTSVDLSENHLTNHGTDVTGIKELAAALGVNGGLTKISLASNKLGEEGTKAICEALEQNKTLKELDISGDWFGSNIGEVKHVAKMLGVNGALTEVRRAQLSSLSPDVLPLALTSGGPSCIGCIGWAWACAPCQEAQGHRPR